MGIGEKINILLILFVILILWRGWHGMKKGFVKEAGGLISLLISLFVISVGILLYTSVKEKDTKNIILSVAVLIVTGLAAKLLHLFVNAISGIADLPILGLLNSVMGIAIGVAEVVVVLWITYIIIGSFDTGSFGLLVTKWTEESELLLKLRDMNKIAYWMTAGL